MYNELMYVFCAISKESRVEKICDIITKLEKGIERKNVIITIDNPDIKNNQIHIKCDNLTILRTSSKAVEETRFGITGRRKRIAQVWKSVQKHLKAQEVSKDEYLLIIEDDGDIPLDSYARLKESFLKKSRDGKCGFVSGVEAGRWRYKIIGAWLHKQSHLQTVPFKESGILQVTSAGTYLMLTKVGRFLDYKPTFTIYFGHDVYFGIALEKSGYKNYIDYSLKVKHINNGEVIEVDRQCVELFYKYIHSTWVLTEVRGSNYGV